MVTKIKPVEDRLTGPVVSVMTVTPAMAESWLKKNTAKNRKVVAGLILKYAEDIRRGRWQMNGSTIVMSESGQIIDGQHRLMAIIEARREIETMVASGIPDSAFETIDSGRRRTASDVLSILGYSQVLELSSLATAWIWWERYGFVEKRSTANYAAPTTQDVIATVDAHAEEFYEAIKKAAPLRKTFLGGTIYAFYWLKLGEIDQSDRDFFFERLADGQNLMVGDPIYALRNALMNLRARNRSMSRTWIGGMVVKAWNKYRNHEKVQILSFSGNEDYPTPV